MGDRFSNVLGRSLGAVNMLAALRSGDLGQNILRQSVALQDPSVRQSIAASPFGAGVLGLGGRTVPVGDIGQGGSEVARAGLAPSQLAQAGIQVGSPLVGEAAPAGREEAFRVNLPPLDPSIIAELESALATSQLKGLNLLSQIERRGALTEQGAEQLDISRQGTESLISRRAAQTAEGEQREADRNTRLQQIQRDLMFRGKDLRSQIARRKALTQQGRKSLGIAAKREERLGVPDLDTVAQARFTLSSVIAGETQDGRTLSPKEAGTLWNTGAAVLRRTGEPVPDWQAVSTGGRFDPFKFDTAELKGEMDAFFSE